MHGLNELDDATYAEVVRAADRIEYEPWMLQAGPELWRRLLPLLPDGRALAEMLMHIARLEPGDLESLIVEVIEDPRSAQQRLAMLGCDGSRDLAAESAEDFGT
jgi:hypothetical protein